LDDLGQYEKDNVQLCNNLSVYVIRKLVLGSRELSTSPTGGCSPPKFFYTPPTLAHTEGG